MKNLRFIVYGIVFAIILTKVEAISWFRINEMFNFESFHMYGVLFSAIAVAAIGRVVLRATGVIEKKQQKPLELPANVIGGLLFGVGWGITGACTGPLYSLIGLHIWPALLVLLGALVGTFIYAALRSKLPHKYEKRNQVSQNTSKAYN